MSSTEKNSGRPKAEPVDGLLLLNKPAGLTSNQALQKVKRLLRAKKAGHTGSLDPAATGMLPLCFGEATKVCAYLLDADKTYRVTAKMGVSTDTGDGDGKETGTAVVPPMSETDWQEVVKQFIGDIEQVPPMYSALKKDGKRLYELARKGETVEREARKIRINDISVLEAHGTRLVLRVSCSKGTYIRTLVEDIAAAAGTVAYTAALHRETVGDFQAADMLELSAAEAWVNSGSDELREHLLTPDVALAHWPAVSVPADAVERFTGGMEVSVPEGDAPGRTRVYAEDGRFLGVGEMTVPGRVAPKRIFRIGGPDRAGSASEQGLGT